MTSAPLLTACGQPVTTAMVLAAGRGTRLGELTRSRPKPLIEVAGQSSLLRTLRNLKAAGIVRAVINLHYLGGQIAEAVLGWQKSGALDGLEILFSEEAELLETGGGTRHALPLLGEGPFLVVNSDAVWDETCAALLPNLVQRFDEGQMAACLALVPYAQVNTFMRKGDFILSDAGWLRFPVRGDDGVAEPAPWVYAGAQVVTAKLLRSGPAEAAFSFLALWWPASIGGQLGAYPYMGPWAEMGTPEGLAAAAALFAAPEPVSRVG